MLDQPAVTAFSHVKPGDTPWVGEGLRDFFLYRDLGVAAGDCVHQRPGITHYLFDYPPDMEYLEVVGPAGFKTLAAAGPAPVPAPWSRIG
jgi:hypothetical protein